MELTATKARSPVSAPAKAWPVTLALAIVYAVVARLCLKLDAVAGFATLVWPPSGIALVGLLWGGFRLWPGVALGAFAVNVWAGATVPVAAGISAGNTLEAVVGAALLWRAGFKPNLERVRDVVLLVSLAALGSTVVSASLGTAALHLGGVVDSGRLWATWRAWWLGDVVGDLVAAPVLLTLATWTRTPSSARRRWEPWALGAAVLLVALFVFSHWGEVHLAEARREYLVFPVLVWAAVRFGVRGATLGTFAISVIAVAGTAVFAGPFADGRLSASLFALQAYMAVVSVSILLLGAVTAERDEAIRKRQEFLEVVSHELKAPLTAIQASTQLLQAKLPADAWGEQVHKRAAVIRRSAERLTRLSQNLLDLAAIESGRLRIEPKVTDVCEVLAEAVEMLRPLVEESSHPLTVEVVEGRCEVACDPERITQVLANLLGNAMKFSPAGAPILVRLERVPEGVRLSVVDRGPGIPPHQLANLFRRHWQAPTTARLGSGLGLFIAHSIVEAHGGAFFVESKVGTGSTFAFTLPARGEGVTGTEPHPDRVGSRA